VATPIGNLGDITLRALEALAEADLVACEDTRITQRLLAHYSIRAQLVALHEHNEAQVTERLLRHLRAGDTVALVSDAGTPLISDPGYRLVRRAHEEGIRVVPIPGPCSAIAALCASGLPTDAFTFFGFLARKGEKRKNQLQEIASSTRTCVIFESPHRALSTIEDLIAHCGGNRPAAFARELTKLHEEVFCGTLEGILQRWRQSPPRGEIVLVIAPGASEPPAEESLQARIEALLAEPEIASLPPAAQAREIARRLGVAKAEVYARILHDRQAR